jgi:hypothetical protein
MLETPRVPVPEDERDHGENERREESRDQKRHERRSVDRSKRTTTHGGIDLRAPLVAEPSATNAAGLARQRPRAEALFVL